VFIGERHEKMKRILKNIKETQIPFENTREACFEEDTTGPENEDVYVDKFVWSRKKSNDNLKDTGNSKGFSFYYARYVFDDDFKYEAFNETNPEKEKTVGIVLQGNQKAVVVIDTIEENGLISVCP
jgi:uncharacterized DUF497 family protein